MVCLALTPAAGGQVASWSYEVEGSYPSDHGAFTQGLYYDEAGLVLGTGQYGRSSLRRVDLESGATLRQRALQRNYFGEGVARFGDALYQLTWKSGVALKYDADTLRPLGALGYRGEGWGLTSDGRVLIMSDGSDRLMGRDPETFAPRWQLRVTFRGRPVGSLNELEYIDGKIFANVWKSNYLFVIDPANGEVVATIDCRPLVKRAQSEYRSAGVLNGIAYDAQRDLLLVTGKNWPRIFALRLEDGE